MKWFKISPKLDGVVVGRELGPLGNYFCGYVIATGGPDKFLDRLAIEFKNNYFTASCPGGLTFAGGEICVDQPNETFHAYLGFDTIHGGDLFEKINGTRDVNYVVERVKDLGKQFWKVAKELDFLERNIDLLKNLGTL